MESFKPPDYDKDLLIDTLTNDAIFAKKRTRRFVRIVLILALANIAYAVYMTRALDNCRSPLKIEIVPAHPAPLIQQPPHQEHAI